MSESEKRAIFEHFRISLAAAGLTTADDEALICPLCWKETRYQELSLEHMVPACVGGRKKILTCKRECNNRHGSVLDSHLGNYLKVMDALQGHGALTAELNVNGNVVAANLACGEVSKDFKIIGKASRRQAWEAIRDDMKAGRVSIMKFKLNLKYARNNFRTAVMRAACLVLFKCFGYEYAQHEVVQAIRRRICDRYLTRPRLETLILELRDCTLPHDQQHLIVQGNVNGVGFFLVIVRLQGKTTTYVGAYLPTPGPRSEEFFDLMEMAAREHDGQTTTIPASAFFT
ncbi:MAG: hypothetical protein HY000_42025 [Planctomycetes bacterium]|nr:hypothetical protein [Planctomycetota bacterium]